jgi:hypothetical protein
MLNLFLTLGKRILEIAFSRPLINLDTKKESRTKPGFFLVSITSLFLPAMPQPFL